MTRDRALTWTNVVMAALAAIVNAFYKHYGIASIFALTMLLWIYDVRRRAR
jgi:hypothetical protein